MTQQQSSPQESTTMTTRDGRIVNRPVSEDSLSTRSSNR